MGLGGYEKNSLHRLTRAIGSVFNISPSAGYTERLKKVSDSGSIGGDFRCAGDELRKILDCEAEEFSPDKSSQR